MSEIQDIINAYDGMNYKESVDHQIKHWAKGIATHNPIGDECCPDFSCCCPSLMMQERARKTFLEAHLSGNDEIRHDMLMMCLGGLVSESGIEAYVAGDDRESTNH